MNEVGPAVVWLDGLVLNAVSFALHREMPDPGADLYDPGAGRGKPQDEFEQLSVFT
ncbi:MAG: hypothetical protein R6U98_07015 [Pirellulaceae bacterium]